MTREGMTSIPPWRTWCTRESLHRGLINDWHRSGLPNSLTIILNSVNSDLRRLKLLSPTNVLMTRGRTEEANALAALISNEGRLQGQDPTWIRPTRNSGLLRLSISLIRNLPLYRCTMPAISSNRPLILVTGSNGYLGTWIVRQLLERRYSVRAAVRTEERGSHLRQMFRSYGEDLQIIAVGDIEKVRIWGLRWRFITNKVTIGACLSRSRARCSWYYTHSVTCYLGCGWSSG